MLLTIYGAGIPAIRSLFPIMPKSSALIQGFTSLVRVELTHFLRISLVIITGCESSSITCPCSLLRLYMHKAEILENSDEYLFRAISASGKRKGLISINKPISYSTYRQSFKKSFANIVPDISSLALIQLGQVELL